MKLITDERTFLVNIPKHNGSVSQVFVTEETSGLAIAKAKAQLHKESYFEDLNWEKAEASLWP